MNIVVIGPGALGLLFAGRLAAGGQAVTLLDHNQQRAASLKNCIHLHDGSGTSSIPLSISADPASLNAAKLILVCVKSHQVQNALATILPYIQPTTVVIGLQNGIAHVPLFQAQTGLFALGVTAMGATLLEPGHVRHGGNGPTFIGFTNATHGHTLADVAEIFSSCQLPAEVENDILSRLWRKLLINCGINGLSVIYDCPNGMLLTIPEARERLILLVSEAIAVAKAMGIEVGDDPLAQTLEVCQATAANISSMLQDVRARRATEIHAINGAVCKLAITKNIATPENDLLVQEVLAVEKPRIQ